MEVKIIRIRDKNYREIRLELFEGIELHHYFCVGGHEFPPMEDASREEDFGIHYCYRGGFEAKLANGKTHYRGAGSVTCSSSRIYHAFCRIPQGSYEGLSIFVFWKRLPGHLRELFEGMEIDFSLISNKFHLKRDWYRAEDPGSVRSLFEEICRELEDRNLRLLRAFVLALIAKVADWSIREIETAEEYIPQKKYHLVQAICRKLEQRENYSVPISRLIEKEPIGYRLFQKIFKEIYGLSPAQYRARHRIHEGCYLLTNTDKSIAEIAGLCGYDNPCKFSAAFKRYIGCTPSHYQRYQTF